MRSFGLLLILSVLVFQSQAPVTKNMIYCFPGICKHSGCDYVEICKNFENSYVKQGGFCQCCGECIITRKRNETCVALEYDWGVRPTLECDKGLECDFLGAKTCIPKIIRQ